MKPFTHVSASQIDTFLMCQRKWYLNKILGLPVPQHPSAALGEQVHKGQETFLADDGEPGAGDEASVHRLAKASLPLLRELRGNVLVERSMKRTLRNGLTFVGRIDIMDLKLRAPRPRIVDWKTTSNMQYAKTEEELRTNVQMLAYAYEAYCTMPTDEVLVAHYVIPTRAGTARYTETPVTRAEIMDGWSRIQDITDEMKVVAEIPNAPDVTPTESACSAYGGCHFRATCATFKNINANPYDDLDKKETPMAALDLATLKSLFGDNIPADLLAQAGGGTGATAAVAATPATSAPASVLPPEAPPSPRDVKNGTAAAPAPTPAPTPKPEATTEDKVLLLKQNGWSEEEINKMGDDTFDHVVAKNFKRDDVVFDEEDDEDSPDGKGIVNVRKKPTTRTRTRSAAPTPATNTQGEATPAESTTRTRGASPERQPRNAVPRLTALGYPANVIEAMDKAEMRQVLDGNDGAGIPYEDEDPEEAGQAAREAEAERVAQERGIPAKVPTTDDVIRAAAEVVSDKDDRIAELEAALADAEELVAKLETQEKKSREYTAQLEMGRGTAETPSTAPRFALYIDCMPERGADVRHLDDVLAPLMAKAAKEGYRNEKTGQVEALTHYALIPFNRGPGIVAAYVVANMGEIAKGRIVVDTRSPCAAAVLEVLRPQADEIVSARGR